MLLSHNMAEVLYTPKFKIGRTSMRIKVPEWNDVVRGVYEALDQIGEIPDCVRSISVLPDTVLRHDGKRVCLGTCLSASGQSHIRIFAGSHNEARLGGIQDLAEKTFRHEVDHATYIKEVHDGLWLDEEPSREEEEEERAERFALGLSRR